MQVLVALDSFKDAAVSLDCCQAVANGLLRTKGIAVDIKPQGDGGEGTLQVIASFLEGEMKTVPTEDPLGRGITASYFFAQDATAYIELAEASGLQRLAVQERNPLITTTTGTGLLMQHAVAHGAQRIVLTLGGSCTNDGGIGIASALGFVFSDRNGNPLDPVGRELSNVVDIVFEGDANWYRIPIVLWCDVGNVFAGPQGAAHIFARQKGASTEAINLLDQGLRNLAGVMERFSGRQILNMPGAGAAGGIAGGLHALLGAEIRSGIQEVHQLSKFEEKVATSDFLITGEGQFDEQALMGKVFSGVAELAKQYDVPIIVVCGQAKIPENIHRKNHIHKIYQLVDLYPTPEESIRNTLAGLERTGVEIGRHLVKNNHPC